VVKGIIVQKVRTKRGERLRIRSKKWVFVPEEKINPMVIPAEGGAFKGRAKGDVFVADSAVPFEIKLKKAFDAVKRLAAKEGIEITENPLLLFEKVTALLYLMGRRAFLKKFLSWHEGKRNEYLSNPYLFYTRRHLDFYSARLISERTLLPFSFFGSLHAFCFHILEEAYKRGKGSLTVDELLKEIETLTETKEEDIRGEIDKLRSLKGLRITFDNGSVYLSYIYFLKKRSIERLKENPAVSPFIKAEDKIKPLLSQKYTILSGTAGTGKTTLLRKIAGFSNRIILSATTGKAAKMLGPDAVTVHSLLGFGGGGFKIKSLNCDLLIVDEASMLDWGTLYAILQAAPRVIFAGDPDQLPPVEGESVFRKMIDVLPTLKLEKVFRFRDLDSNVKEIPVKDEGAAISMIRKIALFLQKKGKEFQIITPIHSGPLGTKRLNLILQRALNPDGGGPLEYKIEIGDRVIVTKNIYIDGELLASNGQTGIVEGKEDEHTVVRTKGEKILFKKDEIELAYALTVHKFQGSEADYIVFVVPFTVDKEFLTDELLFVGKTRGKLKTFVVTPEEKGNIYKGGMI
jgi:hypothetical protein